jgi:hypothetical protein
MEKQEEGIQHLAKGRTEAGHRNQVSVKPGRKGVWPLCIALSWAGGGKKRKVSYASGTRSLVQRSEGQTQVDRTLAV